MVFIHSLRVEKLSVGEIKVFSTFGCVQCTESYDVAAKNVFAKIFLKCGNKHGKVSQDTILTRN